jgi:hypothetical protein
MPARLDGFPDFSTPAANNDINNESEAEAEAESEAESKAESEASTRSEALSGDEMEQRRRCSEWRGRRSRLHHAPETPSGGTQQDLEECLFHAESRRPMVRPYR